MVLAGGRGRRLGGIPKGLEIVGAARIIDRVAAALERITPELVLAADPSIASDWLPGVRVVADVHVGAGGLAGVEAALLRGRDAVVVAWDMPFVSTDLLRALCSNAAERDAMAVLPASDSPHGFEPFCAFYATRTARPLTNFLDSGGGGAHDFIRALPGAEILSIKTVRQFGDPARMFLSVNTPEDLARARAIAEATE